jgi:murein DD-endopeptidase MepM/ murein hydrolase activator NlpD
LNIIIVSDKLGASKTIVLDSRRLALAVSAWLALPVLLAGGLFYLALTRSVDIDNPFLRSLIVRAQQDQLEKSHAYLQANLDAMAVKLGQMQAQVARMEALGERLVKLAGLNPKEFRFDRPPGQGGPEEGAVPSRQFSQRALQREIARLAATLEDRSDRLTVLEAMYTEKRLSHVTVPSLPPVESGEYSSNYGWRIDPFSGRQAFHEGVDFMADVGTPVRAAAGGVVIYAQFNGSGYGNCIEIDHGNGIISRYAHLSRMIAREGDIVLKGQRIGLVGNTGRSTGPHLHFEIRIGGAPQNPAPYLQTQG